MAYYAIAHTYGGNMRRGDNRRMGLMVRFDTIEERDKWCASGPASRTEHKYREALEASDPDIAYFHRGEGIVAARDLQDPTLANWL